MRTLENRKLKDCPFCGGRAVIATKEEYFVKFVGYIFCERCGASIPDNTDKEDMIAHWNSRKERK